MKRLASVFAGVAGALVLGACGVPEESEPVVEVQEAEVSAMACTPYSMGSLSSCKPTATWKIYASDHCASLGLTLGSYTVGVPCGTDSYRYVKYTCCP